MRNISETPIQPQHLESNSSDGQDQSQAAAQSQTAAAEAQSPEKQPQSSQEDQFGSHEEKLPSSQERGKDKTNREPENLIEIGETVFIDGSAYSDPNLGKIIRAVNSAGKDVAVFDFNGVIANQPDLTYKESLVMNPEAPRLIEKFINEGYVPVLASTISRDSLARFMKEHPQLQGLFKVALTRSNFEEDFPYQRDDALNLAVQDGWLTKEEVEILIESEDKKLIPALFPPSQTQGRKTIIIDDNIEPKEFDNYLFIQPEQYLSSKIRPGSGNMPEKDQFSSDWLNKVVAGIEF